MQSLRESNQLCECTREDADNANGGMWVIKVEKLQSVSDLMEI